MVRITLYNYWRSSSSHRVRIALALKGLDYEYVAVDLVGGQQRSAEHVARSPTGRVPCLVLDGESFVESVAIIELLDERFPAPPLYPSDPAGRARVRALVEIVNSATQPFQNNTLLAHLGKLGFDEAAQEAWLHHYLGKGLAAFERAMQDHARAGVTGPYAYGASVTAADAYLVPQIDSARRFGVDLGACPRIVAAYDAAMALEPFRKAAPAAQPDAPRG
ncbi:MAG: maleylacetoacetate isomerase [Polyangiaceae bacterium]